MVQLSLRLQNIGKNKNLLDSTIVSGQVHKRYAYQVNNALSQTMFTIGPTPVNADRLESGKRLDKRQALHVAFPTAKNWKRPTN